MADETRVREIIFRIAEVMREVVWEYEITEDELHAAGEFLNGVGRAGVFPSMVDIACAMTVIDRLRDGVPGTRPNMEGPEYRPGAPERPDGILLEHDPGPDAEFLTLSGRVTDAGTGEAIPNAAIDLWHTDEHGGYDREGHHLRGVVRTAEDGSYRLRTILPKDYAEHKEDPIGELLAMMGRHSYRAAHIHLKVHVDGEERLTTQVFRGDSPYLDTDYVIGAVSDDLVLDLKQVSGDTDHGEYTATFDIALAPVNGKAG